MRLIHRIGRRGAFLLFLALLDLIYGFSFMFPPQIPAYYPTYAFLSSIMPLEAWGLLWMGVGVICLIFAFKKYDAPAYAAAMFLKSFWAAVFLLGWMFVGLDRGWVSATVWGAFAAVLALISTWPEPGYETRHE